MYSEDVRNKINAIVRAALFEQDARTYNGIPISTGELGEETTTKIIEVIEDTNVDEEDPFVNSEIVKGLCRSFSALRPLISSDESDKAFISKLLSLGHIKGEDFLSAYPYKAQEVVPNLNGEVCDTDRTHIPKS